MYFIHCFTNEGLDMSSQRSVYTGFEGLNEGLDMSLHRRVYKGWGCLLDCCWFTIDFELFLNLKKYYKIVGK